MRKMPSVASTFLLIVSTLTRIVYGTDTVPGMEAVDIGVGCTGETYGSAFKFVLDKPEAQFLALQFEQFNLLADDYLVIQSNNDDEDDEPEKVVIRGQDQLGGFMSDAFDTTSLTIEIYYKSGNQQQQNDKCTGFRITGYYYAAVDDAMLPEEHTESVFGIDDSREAKCYRYMRQVYTHSKAVARLLLFRENNFHFCTGWLVGCEDHIMTSAHCVGNQNDTVRVQIQFMAEGKKCSQKCRRGGACRGKVRASSATIVSKSVELDYAMLKPHTHIALNKEYGFLRMRETLPKEKEKIFIPQHPSGWGKRIVVKSNGDYARVNAVEGEGLEKYEMSYYADTRGGSSGAPVIGQKDMAVIAVHRAGGHFNVGIQTHEIVDHLKKEGNLPKCALPFDEPEAEVGELNFNLLKP